MVHLVLFPGEHPFFPCSWPCGKRGLLAHSQPGSATLSLFLFSWINPLIVFIIISSLMFPCDSYCPPHTIWQCSCPQGLLDLPSALLSTAFLLGNSFTHGASISTQVSKTALRSTSPARTLCPSPFPNLAFFLLHIEHFLFVVTNA